MERKLFAGFSGTVFWFSQQQKSYKFFLILKKIVNYPVTRALKREEQAIMWKYRYYLTQNKKALTKFLQCFDLNLEFEGKMLMELMLKWQPMDVEDALELLGSKYRNYPKIRSYAISRLTLASNDV